MHLRRHIERTLRIKREATTVNDDVKRKLTITLAAMLAIGAGGYFYVSQDTRSSNHRFATGARQAKVRQSASQPGRSDNRRIRPKVSSPTFGPKHKRDGFTERPRPRPHRGRGLRKHTKRHKRTQPGC